MKIIDAFKCESLYKDLEQNVSPLILSIFDNKFTFLHHPVKDRIHLIEWFKPDTLYRNPLPQPFDGDMALKKSKKFNLQDHWPAYIFLFLVNHLYSERKDVLIEDVCCGVGRTEVYLNYLGFKNFHLIDNFSQISEEVLRTFLKEANVNYRINESNVNPDISYISGYPTFPKEVNDSIELFCHYSNPSMIGQLTPTLKNKGFVNLCRDVDNLMWAWCKESKVKEFHEKLQDYIVGESNEN